MTKMKSKEFIRRMISAATDYKTLYVMGCFGAPMNSKNKVRYTNNHNYNKQATRKKMIQSASDDTFGFDCVCLIKGILWGWDGDPTKVYGGAEYASNGVPDINADMMIKKCAGVSTDFSNITPGEVCWMAGHIGVYIGDGLAVECTPAWDNRVQITAVGNIGKKPGYNTRTWRKHGKLPYVDYSDQVEESSKEPSKQETVKPSGPVYHVGKVYQTQVELRVRTGPSTKYRAKTHAELTADGRAHDVDHDGALNPGTKVTCLQVAHGEDRPDDIWIKGPSGWMAAYYGGKYYIK